MSNPTFASNRRGNFVIGSDGADQIVNYNSIVCVTAGNFVFTLIDPATGLESATITLAMTATQELSVMPKKILATGLTGTYLGLVTS